jgi:hypothetical protein
MDSVEITLPVSGSKVEIRNYTTKADDIKAEAVLYAGVSATPQTDKEGKTTADIKFPVANMSGSLDVYVNRLVQSLDGDNTNLKLKLENLRSKDYQAISDAVDKIVSDNSPKVTEAKEASINLTTEK